MICPNRLLPLWSAAFALSMLASPDGARAHSFDSPAPAAQTFPVRLRFSNADVSDVLQAISLKTRANIVYPAQLKRPISLNVSANSVEEALNFVTGAASLAWRRVGSTYVIAPADSLRAMVEQFGEHVTAPLTSLSSVEAVSIISSALPYLTARPAGTSILLIGAPEDIAQARAILDQQEAIRRAEPQVREVVNLEYAAAPGVGAMIKALFPDLKVEGAGAADKPGGSIGIYGPATEVRAARDVIRSVDVPTGPRIPDRVYRIYHIKHSSAPVLQSFMQKAAPSITVNVGPEAYSPPMPGFRPLSGATLGTSNTGTGGSGGFGGGGFGGGSGSNSSGSGGFVGTAIGINAPQTPPKEGDKSKLLVLSGSAADLDIAFKLLDDVDIPPKQVMVEVKVVDTSPERAENLGLNWDFGTFKFLDIPKGSPLTGSPSFDPSAPVVGPANIATIGRAPFTFQAKLNAMVQRQEAKILANPRMQVLENDDANIFIGDTLRTELAQAGIAGTTIQVFEFPIGIILLVRPRISPDGTITMRVHPVVSTITSIGASGLPQTASREAETTVMVNDGETVVIGGLIRDEMTKTINEVPLLSKLPLVGELFRNRSTDHRHSDVLVFITPHIVK